MRFSLTAALAYSAASASAAAVPSLDKRARLVNLSVFEANAFPISPPPPEVLNHTANSFRSFGPATKLAAAGGCNNPPARIEWRRLSDGDKTNFVRAVRCLMDRPSAGGFPGSRSRYEDLVSVHQQMGPTIHAVGHFLPWHRYYVAIFESLLRDECGYQGPMTWWDETRDRGNFHGAPLFTSQWFGSAPYRAGSDGTCVEDGVSMALFQKPLIDEPLT
jgi:tyrosinase